MKSILCIITLALSGSILLASQAGPKVSNRTPEGNEIGYRPADGSTPRLNPPSLTWLHEPEAATYTVQWAQRPDWTDAQSAGDLPFNVYTHHSPLRPGRTQWRYRFTTKDGKASDWSLTRSFTVTADAVEFPMPTRAQQQERVPAGHPRLFMRPEDLPRLRELANGREAKRFAALRAEADRLLAAGPTPEPTVRGSARDPQTKAFWWPNRQQTEKACVEAETLAFVYLITGEKAYGEGSRRWIVHLAGWDPDGPTNFTLNCEAAKPILFRLPRAYDWAYAALTPADRKAAQAVMARRARDAWESGEVGRGVGHLNRPYSSHGNRTWHKLGEAAIALLGDVPEAATWLDYAVNKFYAAYPVWADDDGGWHEGVAYWGSYQTKVVWWLQVAKSALGIDGARKPFFAQVGDFPLYVAPPNSPNSGFGDLSHNPPSRGAGTFLEYHLRAAQSPSAPLNSALRVPHSALPAHWRWWAEQWKTQPQEGILGFLYAANLGPLPAAKPPTDIPTSKVFHGIGIASLHRTLLDSNDDVHFLFKSSPFGSQSHGHNPQNSFQLNAYGESLLTTCVYRDLHGSPFHYKWAHSTLAHNAVLVDGEGQVPHNPAPVGRISAAQLGPQLDYVVGDAAPAYGDRLKRYRRHVAFVKPDLIVLYDDLEAKQPATFQFMLHALKPFTVDEQGVRLSVEQPRAGVAARYLSPLPLTFRQWDGYDPKPDREFPNQWHVEAATHEKRPSLGMLTVIVPHRAGAPTDWTAERLESDTALAARIRRAGKTVTVAFRKEGIKGRASLPGLTFNEAVIVR